MATLALGALGAAAGNAFLPTGLSFLGQAAGRLVGAQIDQALFGAASQGRSVDGPRLSDLHITGSSEGAAIPRLYGRARIGGQLIWATALDEETASRSAGGASKGGRSAATGVNFAYYGTFAIGLCAGEITGLGRVWADGREIDLSDFTTRLYSGSELQTADPLIALKQGGAAPAFRGLAYIVFEHMPLADFGNRIPQLSFEISRAVDSLEQDIRAVTIIPGSGEFVYAQSPVARSVGRIRNVAENVHSKLGSTDWDASLDQLQSSLPNVRSASLVVSWFGTDLRAGHCQLRPLVERADKITTPLQWAVAGETRSTAAVVSQFNDRSAYGGTPSDDTVVGAIRDLRARGLAVVLSPFILMDIPPGNALPDPYSTAATQPAYPWRGRISASPAAGQPGSPDQTAAADAQVANLVGQALAADFSVVGDAVIYAGPTEWTYRRFILHYAHLCAAAGGVDAFVLGSEFRGLTTVRGANGQYAFVAALVQLAAEVRSILGPATKILYAADWSEYFGHQPSDGSGDVTFHLDPLWASPHIDAIGIDVYWPLADWRDGASHIDATTGVASPHDLSYLKANLSAGEGFDWYYASQGDRDAQNRSPITDGLGEPWVFRYKDIKAWWTNAHFNRSAGVESTTPTAWIPQSKPFWLMEIGCPAVDKGANQPNVFIDAKSAESSLPHYSSGARDDLMQRRVLQAFVEGFNPAHTGYITGSNPISAVTGQRMVDSGRLHVYAWDARPYPAFPNNGEIWRDAENWRLGHWINGRTASAPLPGLVASLLGDYDFTAFDAARLTGTAAGLVLDRVMSAREALQPLELAYFIDTLESEGQMVFRPRGAANRPIPLDASDLVEERPGKPLTRLTRAQEADLPVSAKISYIASTADYPQAVAEARRISGSSGRVSSAALGLVLDPSDAAGISENWLFEAWAARERATFTLPPSRLAMEPGDTIDLNLGDRRYHVRITDIGDHGARDIEARTFDADIYRRSTAVIREPNPVPPTTAGPPLVIFLDLPPGSDTDAASGLIAAAQDPWPGTVAVYRSPEQSGFVLSSLVPSPATTGLTSSVFAPGPAGRMDYATAVTVVLDRGTLQSVTALALLGGANTAAVEHAPDGWEVFQFQSATLIAPSTYRLSGLLRGQRGTDGRPASSALANARFVLLDEAVAAVPLSPDDLGLPLNWRTGPASRDIGDARYSRDTQSFSGHGLKPFAPSHIRATRTTTGDLTLTWVRRTRINGDSWETSDVPLGETTEHYHVEILAGAAVLRTLATTTPTAIYTAAQQTADFGSPPPRITVRIAQVSATVGRGYSRTAAV